MLLDIQGCRTKTHIFAGLNAVLVLFIVLLAVPAVPAELHQKLLYSKTINKGLKTPLRLAPGTENDYYISDYVTHAICHYDSSGNFINTIKIGFSPTCIASPDGIIFYIGDRQNSKIVVMDSSGRILNNFNNIEQPSDAVFAYNLLYITESKKNRVSVFDQSGNFHGSFGKSRLTFPTGIAFDKKNRRILVAEHGGLTPADSSGPAPKIHLFDLNGNWIAAYGTNDNEGGKFARIQGLAVDHLGRIYAVDPFQGRITVLDENGIFLTSFGELGSSAGKLKLPMDVMLDANNRLWVTSFNTSAVVIYDLKGLPTGINDGSHLSIPLQYRLFQNYPNPFNPSTVIRYQLSASSEVKLTVYNISGQKVRELVNKKQKAGSYSVVFNAHGLASGVYFYRLQTNNGFIKTRKLLFVK